MRSLLFCFRFFIFHDTATIEIYTLSLHDALPIFFRGGDSLSHFTRVRLLLPFLSVLMTILIAGRGTSLKRQKQDRKSTRLNSSHTVISYAVFCLKKKKTPKQPHTQVISTTINPYS